MKYFLEGFRAQTPEEVLKALMGEVGVLAGRLCGRANAGSPVVLVVICLCCLTCAGSEFRANFQGLWCVVGRSSSCFVRTSTSCKAAATTRTTKCGNIIKRRLCN